MSSSTARRLVAALAAGVLGMLALAGTSQGAAETGTFGPFVQPFTDTVDDTGTCLGPGAVGTISGTETVFGHYTENGPPAFGFHDHGTFTNQYRVDYSDGRYVVGSDLVHFSDNATHRDQFTSSIADHASGTVYDAAGQVLGTVTIHAMSHVTYRDADGNHQPDPGEVTASVDHFRFTCR
jgi:hypothetical protein